MLSKSILSATLISAVAASAFPGATLVARQQSCQAPTNVASVFSNFPPIPAEARTALTVLPTGSTICANPLTDATASSEYASWTSAGVSYLLAGNNGDQVSSAIVYAASSCTALVPNILAMSLIGEILNSCGTAGATTPLATPIASTGGSSAATTAAPSKGAAPAQTVAAAAGMLAAGLFGVLAL